MEVRTKPAMRKGMLRSVLVGTFSVGLAISAFSGLDLDSGAGNTKAVSEPGVETQDIVWTSGPAGDIVWSSASKDDIVWGSKSAGSDTAPSAVKGVDAS